MDGKGKGRDGIYEEKRKAQVIIFKRRWGVSETSACLQLTWS